MAAPSFVPTLPTQSPRDYSSAPWRMDPWTADRPGEFMYRSGQPGPDAGGMGVPGPDQGYVLKLLPLFRNDIRLAEGEQLRDAEAVGVAVALKRAGIFGRAPISHDLRVAYTVWGLLDSQAPKELVALRTERIEGMHLRAHHYPQLRAVVDMVPAATLRLSPAEVADAHRRDWRSLLAL